MKINQKDFNAMEMGAHAATDFELFGDLEITKSCTGTEEGEPSWMLEGHVLNRTKDASGETPILEKMDWAHFLNKGVLKYEHDDRNRDGNPIARPFRVIGVPHELQQEGDHVYLKAALLEDQPMAKDTRNLILSLQKHNKKFPEKKRTLGFSIEGNYLLQNNGKYAGRVINAVVTPNPQEISTWADIRDRHNRELAKSLAAGYANTPGKQAGGAALRRESLRGAGPVSMTWRDEEEEEKGKKKKKKANPSKKRRTEPEGGKTMSKTVELEFETYDQAYEFLKSDFGGLSDEEAQKRASELFPDHQEEDPEQSDELEKSLKENTGLLKDLSGKITRLFKSEKPDEGDEEEEPDEQELNVSADGNWIDAAPLLKDIRGQLNRNDKALPMLAKALETIGGMQRQMAEILAGSVSNIAIGEGTMQKSEVDELKEKVEKLEKENQENKNLIKAIESTEIGFTFSKLAQEKIAGEGEGVPITKAEVLSKLTKAAKENPSLNQAVTEFSIGGRLAPKIYRDLGYDPPPMDKSIPVERLS